MKRAALLALLLILPASAQEVIPDGFDYACGAGPICTIKREALINLIKGGAIVPCGRREA